MPQTDTTPFDTTRARRLADEYGGRLQAIVHQACDEIDTDRRGGRQVMIASAPEAPTDLAPAYVALIHKLEQRVNVLDRSLHAVSGNSSAISRRVDDLEDRIGPVKLIEAMPAIRERLARLEMPNDAALSARLDGAS